MEDKKQIQQNEGAQQGNTHADSDTGTNESGHPGSTLRKDANSGKVLPENEDAQRNKMSADKDLEDTLGIP